MLKGQQKRITTPGHNQKYYLAGALHSGTGRVHYVGGSKKCSDLFINLLEALQRTCRRAKTMLHETITRNHQCRHMWQLLEQVKLFMNAASPFPSNQYSLANVER